MKAQLLSDLHCEFFPSVKSVEAFCKTLLTNAGILILAGDIGLLNPKLPPDGTGDNSTPRTRLNTALDFFCRHWPNVIYVPGNHEVYHGCFKDARTELQKLQQKYDNLYTSIDPFSVKLHGKRIHCTTLWFEPDPNHAMWWNHMSDAYIIGDTQTPKQNYEGNAPLALFEQRGQDAVNYLEQHVQPSDIVVTHHLPLWSVVHPSYKRDILTHFFVNEDAHTVIEECRPSLWVHGHSHSVYDTTVGDTRVVCNPYGYHAGAFYSSFNYKLLLEI